MSAKHTNYKDRQRRGRRVADVEVDAAGIARLVVDLGYCTASEAGDRRKVDRALGDLLEEIRLAKIRARMG